MAMDDAGQLHFRCGVLTTRLNNFNDLLWGLLVLLGNAVFSTSRVRTFSISATRTLHDLGQHSG
jgi:hypothetical protein